MNCPKYLLSLAVFLILIFPDPLNAQITSNVYHFDEKKNGETIRHELKIDGNYFVHSIYKEAPPTYIRTYGGYYTTENNAIKLALEFDSDYENQKSKTMNIPYRIENETLILESDAPMTFVTVTKNPQSLDGKWLFSGRMTDKGEDRVDTSRPRKTMKFLMDGHFQWIAFNTETMEFFGTGGGTYLANDSKYTENIGYFSRDNARVGASLTFDYELKGADWHHSGKSSKGDPLHEIWIRRE
ncbi:hypothetical protein [Arenibacter certesii]|uniref:Membrane or secreted protein n=1 Tax=Arenibacter certesii TaxID=228955 RepID=A0A918J5R7_9FLAO|nr:hypothetical protein [Arenibacter certesii]GGW49721.1 hypothetical protein GCM10007383_37010 [Arenibacter certesii]